MEQRKVKGRKKERKSRNCSSFVLFAGYIHNFGAVRNYRKDNRLYPDEIYHRSSSSLYGMVLCLLDI